MNELKNFLFFKKDIIPKVITLLLVFSSITGFVKIGDWGYYSAIAIIGLLIAYKGSLRYGNLSILVLLFVCAFTLLANNPPSYFRAWQRLGVYVLVLVVISSMFISKYSVKIKTKTFEYFWLISTILSISSFFCYYLGINYFVRYGVTLEIGAGTFSGLLDHSMSLGPIAGLSCIYLFVPALLKKGWGRYIYGGASMLCLGACFFSASRSAVGATIIGCVFAIFVLYKNKLSKFSAIILLLITIGAATFPIWGGVTDLVVQKQEANRDMGSDIYSREQKFQARLIEFKSSPVYGIGFCTVDPRYDEVNQENGQIEPGSSWLAIASMTGILGLLVFIPIVLRAIHKVWVMKDMYWKGILGGMLIFFVNHMIAEGYIFAPRSFLSLLFWLIIAEIDGLFLLEKRKS